MPGAERDGEGNLRGLSVVRLAVEFVAVAQQHAEPKDGNTQNQRMATRRTKSATGSSLRRPYITLSLS